MADENRVLQAQFASDLDQVVGIAVRGGGSVSLIIKLPSCDAE
jgi:hypothetical protein